MSQHTQTIKELCKMCIARCEARGYKGKRRDDMAFEFFVGAVRGIELMNDVLAQQMMVWVTLVLSTRGYKGIVEEAAQ